MRILTFTEDGIKKVKIKFTREDLIEILQEIPEVRDEMDRNYDAKIKLYTHYTTYEKKATVRDGFPFTMEIPLK